ncbi:hypothetical protein FB561_2790 [Kribbella amoyensis]|uniref:Uncharacterized protein n=1 Tax=Kribbella amoyensis TaxID=996641 RepID=A0A561BRZ0_9ACTN|nr:hypothetical protein [Kribbella amoyensis]TWD81670.1 hypothetical protein FB561_2790 [Kribbella amoyensis]
MISGDRAKRRLKRRLWGPPTLKRRHALFKQELVRATSQLATAVRQGEEAATEGGLQLIRALVLEAVRYHSDSIEVSPAAMGGPSVYGREWGDLLQSLERIREAAHCSDHARLRTRVINFFLDLLVQLFHDRHLPAGRNVAGSLGWMWADMDNDAGSWSAEDRDYFLMRLRETATYVMPARLNGPDASAAAIIYCYLFATMFRRSLAVQHYDSARDVVMTLIEARPNRAENDFQKSFAESQDATLLSLLAWMLLTRRNDAPDAGERELLDILIGGLDGKDLWNVTAFALGADFSYQVGADSWESERNYVRGRSSGFIQIDTYVRVAALVIGLSRGSLRVPTVPDEKDGSLAQTMKELLDSLVAGSPPQVAVLIERVRDDRLRNDLQRLIDAKEAVRAHRLAGAELDAVKVSAFHEAVEDSLRKIQGIRELMLIEQRPTAGPPQFGFNQLEAKWWFVDMDVDADPKALAEDLVRGLIRGEDASIIEAVRDSEPSDTVSINQLPGILEDWAVRHDVTEVVIVTNSWRAYERLAGVDALLDEASTRIVRIGPLDAKLCRTVDSTDPFVAVMACSGAVTIHNGSPLEPQPPEMQVHGDRVLASVSILTPDMVEAMTEVGVRTALDLRQQVVVKLLEHFTVEVSDRSRVGFWALPEREY